MNNFFAYLRSKMFLKNLALAVALALGIFFVLLIYLRVYTHHGKSITVPDLSDLPVEDAGRILKERNLRYEIFDSLYVAARQAGVIIDQHPKAGKEVKKRRKVYFTINASSPEKILMPDLVGITLREASTKMQIAGLKTGKFIYRYNIGKNVVLEQLYNSKVIQANDTIVKGAVIDLVLGKGLSNEKSMVPDLIGLTKDQAIARAAEALFTIHSAIPDKSVKEDGELQPFV
jgi:beta-lactam-binding protein with PASTA domain